MQTLIGVEHRLRWRREKILSRAAKSTTTLTGMPHGSGTHNAVESGAIDLSELDAAYREAFEELEAMREELADLLPQLGDPDDIAIMRIRYIDGRSPGEIPDIVYLSERAVCYHLARAERKLCELFPSQVIRRL